MFLITPSPGSRDRPPGLTFSKSRPVPVPFPSPSLPFHPRPSPVPSGPSPCVHALHRPAAAHRAQDRPKNARNAPFTPPAHQMAQGIAAQKKNGREAKKRPLFNRYICPQRRHTIYLVKANTLLNKVKSLNFFWWIKVKALTLQRNLKHNPLNLESYEDFE